MFLRVATGTRKGETYPVTGDFIIGREDSCHLVFEEPEVSRTHARLTVRDGACFIKDMDSSNGTLVNFSASRKRSSSRKTTL